MNAELTAPKSFGTPFKPGQSGNPAGRPVGARSRLAEQFLDAMRLTFDEGGVDAVRKVMATDPATYLKVIASLVPKELDIAGADGAPLPAIVVTFVRPE